MIIKYYSHALSEKIFLCKKNKKISNQLICFQVYLKIFHLNQMHLISIKKNLKTFF